MREEIELAEVPIAEIVVAYVDRAYDDGELDLESASEFLVLIAALPEIKVRMRVPGPVPGRPARAAGVRLRRGRRRARQAVACGRVPRGPRDVEAGRGAGRAERGVRADPDRPARPGPSRVGARHRMSELTHTVEALLFVASEPLSVADIATLADAPPARVERALDALRDHYCEERSGVVLERVAGGYGFRASR